MGDYYSVLEVPFGADAEAVKASYKRLAKVWHPDKNPRDPRRATSRFQLVRFPLFFFMSVLKGLGAWDKVWFGAAD